MPSMFSFRRVLRAAQWMCFGTMAQRRRVRQELAQRAANLFGDYPIGDDAKIWRTDVAFRNKFAELSPHNLFSEERKFNLRAFARMVKPLSGVMAECGSYVGVSAWFMANEAPETPLFLFDSFEGLSEPGNEDAPEPGIMPWQAGDMSATEAELRANLAQFDNFVVLKGWIPERFDEVVDRTFKLVHLDVDLYQPTLDSLAFFYPRMIEGGVIVMDDYGFQTCPGAYRAANEFFADKTESVLHLSTGQGVVIRR